MSSRLLLTSVTAAMLLAGIAMPAHAASTCTHIGTPAANTALVKVFYRALDRHDPSLLDQVLAKDWTDIPAAPGQASGRAGMKGAMAGYYASFPDFHVVNDDFVAQGDKVVVRSTIQATQRGSFAGVPASGKPFSITAVDIHQICDGRVVKTWHVEDWLSGLFQMGALPPATGKSGK
jgi:steroid delta-isomerase-like uncharacterized protein